ncbi:ABC transporter substrate-binding protein [Devosia sp. J2-20]|uniref:ABC transporter substrate-binding protein n=1 Tax=Devosia sp. J2-20 TaxID=3026161 RepID=UPI00249C5EBB|nr:ABC transporter substrate-binding protein [Devosia sp. J2-20]WDQ99953.1 ABC transporter substrate-binding protein [Devosia sp. J2-20]
MNKFAAVTGLLMGATLFSGSAMAQTTLSMWYHGAGNEVEAGIINDLVSDFNASQSDWVVELESFPQAAYNDSVVAGALAGNLPDILDVDGPVMPNWAWSGYMQPLQIDEIQDRQFPARHQGHVGWQALLHRPVGCRGRAGNTPVHSR